VHFTLSVLDLSDFHVQTSYKILFNLIDLVMKRLYCEAEALVNEGVPECTLHFFRISQTFKLKLLTRFYSTY